MHLPCSNLYDLNAPMSTDILHKNLTLVIRSLINQSTCHLLPDNDQLCALEITPMIKRIISMSIIGVYKTVKIVDALTKWRDFIVREKPTIIAQH